MNCIKNSVLSAKSIWRRILSLVLIFAMTAGFVPAQIFAVSADAKIDSDAFIEMIESAGDEETEVIIEFDDNKNNDETELPDNTDIMNTSPGSLEITPLSGNPMDFNYTILNGTYISITGYMGIDPVMVIPNIINEYIVQEIGSNAFQNRTDIISVFIPGSIEVIGSSAFSGCVNITEVTLNEGLISIGSNAFLNCTNLSSLAFPNSLTTINNSAFSGCTGLVNINFPDFLTTIGQSAFSGCTGLVNVSLPDSVTTMGYYVFQNCTNLTTINYPRSLNSVDYANSSSGAGLFVGCTKLLSVTIPEGVTAIPAWTFSGSTSLREVILPSTLETIGQSAFRGCTALTEITLPDDLMTIESNAFFGCTSLASVTMPDGLKSIGSSAFSGCTGLVNINFPDFLTTIGNSAFSGCTGLVNVSLPDSVTTMGYYVFQNCTNLTTINYPRGLNSVDYANTSSGAGLFAGCTKLLSVTVPEGVTAIPAWTFSGSTSLREVILPSTLETIGQSAFRGCTGLGRTIILPNNLTHIEDNAFSGCIGLANIIWSYNLYRIGNNAFSGCNGLVNISLPINLVEIGNSAFANCVNLFTILIPQSVTSFGTNIFTGVRVGFMIFGMIGSEAEWYALDNGFLFASFEDHITLIADATTNLPVINISGYASSNSVVKIYDEDSLIGTFTANRTNRYSGTVTLVGGYGAHVLRAETVGKDGGTIFTTQIVIYMENAPRLTKFMMYHGGQAVDLITTTGIRQTLIFTINGLHGSTFTFEVKTENSDQIEKMYICSERVGETKYMEAVYDVSKDIWLATGYFDPTNTLYVPGTLSVVITTEKESIYETSSISLVEYYDEEKTTGILAKVQYHDSETSEEYYHLNETVNDVSFQISDDFTQAMVDGVMQYMSNEPVYVVRDGYGFACYELYILQGNGLYTVHRLGIGLQDESLMSPMPGFRTYASDPVKDIFDETKNLLKFLDETTRKKNPSDLEKERAREELNQRMRSILNSNTLTPQERNTLERIYLNIQLTNMLDDVMPVFKDLKKTTKMDTGFSYLDKKLEKEANKSIDAMGKYADSIISALKQSTANDLPDGLDAFLNTLLKKLEDERKKLGQSNGATTRIIVDPSGYVFEAVTANRLAGVTVTVYHKGQYPEYGTLDDNAFKWDAEDYDQDNPLITDFEGRYAWDVPEGFWMVTYEKDGYETTDSTDRYGWLPVPPPQLEVHVGMVSLATPEIAWLNVYDTYAEIEFTKYMKPETMQGLTLKTPDGTQIPYTLEYSREETCLDGVVYAKRYKLIYENHTAAAGNYSVTSGADNLSYADVRAKPETIYAPAALPLSLLMPENVTVDYDSEIDIAVKVVNYNPSDPVTVTAQSDFDFIARVTNVSPVSSDGIVTIRVSGSIPGPANIIIRIPEKGIEETLPVWVNMPSEKSYILISPAAANISKGGVLQFTAVESDDGTPANVIWSVSGNKSSGTVINTNGLLTVDENETAEVLTVTAVCADDYSRYSNVTVNIISNQTTILPGDVNGDDKVDMADLVALARHIAGLETITPALLPAADTNRDNRVNIADLIRLARYLAGVDSSPLG